MYISENIKEFFQTLSNSFLPHRYKHLVENSISQSFNYFLSIIALSLIVMLLISIPFLFILPKRLSEEYQKFTTLKFDFEAAMNDSIVLGIKTPQIVIDTTGKHSQLGNESLLITDKNVHYKFLGLKGKINITEFNDLTTKKSSAIGTVIFFLAFFLPSLLIWLFIAQFLKYSMIIIGVSIMSIIGAKILKYNLNFKRVLSIALYASTIMIIIDTLIIPFNLGKYALILPIFLNYGVSIITIFLFLTIFIAAVIMVGNKEFAEGL